MSYRDKHNFASVPLNRCREGPLWPGLELALEKGAMEMLGSVTTARATSASGGKMHLFPSRGPALLLTWQLVGSDLI